MGEDPQPSHSFEALVTHVIDAEKFWVQPLYNNEDRKKLTIIESALGANPKPVSKILKPDDYVSVKLNERGWKRARMKQHIQHSLAHVQLIDYGNDEQVPESVVFSLSSELGIDVLNEQAMMCSIAGVKSNPRQQSVGQYLNGILLNRKVSVKAYSISPQGELLVDLTTAEIQSIRHHVLLHQIGTPGMIPAAPHTQDPGTVQTKIGEKNAVIISHISDLTDFYVQYRAAEKSIASMMTAMKSMYAANVHSPANLINIGMLCTVQLGSDWFRAEVKQVLSTGFILVMLKDFGNLQQVTAKQIYPLEGNLMKTPFYAIRCGLNNILPSTPTATGSFPKQLIQWFERYAADQNAYYTAKFIRKSDNRFYIELFDESGTPGSEPKPSTIDLLITNNCAKRVANNFSAYGGMQQQLNQMGVDMFTNLTQSASTTQQQLYNSMLNGGMNGGAPLSSGLTPTGMPATPAGSFSAYNGSSLTPNTMQQTSPYSIGGSIGTGMSQQQQQQQPLTQTSSYLNNNTAPDFAQSGYPGNMPSSIAQQPTSMAHQPSSMAHQPSSMAHQPSSMTQQPGNLAQQPGNLAQQPGNMAQQPRVPRSRGENKVPADVHEKGYERPNLSMMEQVAVEIVHSPWDFICLLDKYFSDVDEINEQMESVYNNSGQTYALPSGRAKRGMACVSPYLENETIRYYRARIESIHQNNADVFFVDYGNLENVPLSDLKYLLTSFAKVPESVIKCSFENVSPLDNRRDWGAGALQAFNSYFKETINFNCHIKNPNHPPPDNVYKVELFPTNGDLQSPISKELEAREVLVCGPDPARGGSANRGRPGRAPRNPEPEHQRERPTPRDRDAEYVRERAAPRDRNVKERGRGDARERSASPDGSAANNELLRSGYRPLSIEMKTYIDVRVTHTSTPSKFACQILTNKEKLEKLYQTMQVYYDEGGEEDVLDDVLPFTACAVFYDGKYQRGYVHSSSYHGCQVVLVDTQQVVSVDQDQLRVMHTNFASFPVQGVKCSLEGIKCKLSTRKWNSETCRFFQEQVSDIDLIAQFRSEKNGVYNVFLHSNREGIDQMVNALFVVKGWAVTSDTIVKQGVEDVQSNQQSKFSMYNVKIGNSLTVSPCYVEGPEEFYLHPVDEQEQIEQMQEKINEFYMRNPAEKPQLNVDSYCVAYWDESWYRARIVSVARGTCEVYFVDFGNTDTVEIANMRGLAKQFRQQPMYAIKCQLEGLNPDNMTKMHDIFMELIDDEMEQALHATFIKLQKGAYLVSLYDGSRPIIEKMFQMLYQGGANLAASKGSSKKQRAHTGPACVPIEDRSLVQISHPDTPHLLYLHSNASASTLESLLKDMGRFYGANRPPLAMKQVGEVCAAQYSDDGEWYRGKIVSQHGDLLQVQFFDYGNEESKPNNEVFELAGQFRDLSAQATPCSLAGIIEPPQGWNDVRDELLSVADMQFTVKVVDDSCDPVQVELFNAEAGVSLTRELINNGYGIDSERKCIPMTQVPRIEGGTLQVKVCYADFPGRLFVQKMSQAEKLEEMLETLKTDYDGNQPKLNEEPKIGTVCCAKYTEDQFYYRATVYGITRQSIKIQYADFGNCEDKDKRELFDLKAEYTLLSAQAIECSLKGCDVTSQNWTSDMQSYLEEVVDQKTFNCQILGREGEAYVVALHEMSSGNSLGDLINRFVTSGSRSTFGQPPANAPSGGFGGATNGFDSVPAAAAPAPAKTDEVVKVGWPPRIDKFKHVPAMISWGDGPEDFWINLVDEDSKLDQLQDKLQTVYENGGRQPSRIFRYMYLAVKSPQFEQIFRGKTLNNDRNCPTIIYLDYGNEEDVPVSNLYELEPFLADVLGAQAIHCALDGVDRLKPEGELRQELKEKFEELLSDKEIEVKNMSPAQRDKPHNDVEILVNGQNAIELLEKELIALSGPPDVALCTAAIGNVIRGALTNVLSPTDFWCQLAGPMANMNESLKNCTDSLQEAPELETYCAAVLGEEDETVYRARVLSKEQDNYTIRCIDYGYQRTVPLKNLYKLKQDCADLAAQAVPCTLPVLIAEGQDEAALAALQTLSTKCVSVMLYSYSEDRFTVDFKETDHISDHTTMFVKAGLGVSTLPSLATASAVYTLPAADPEATYFISHINNLADFYVQKSDLDADALAATVGAACTGMLPALSSPTRGSPCVAKDSTYHAWNRAIITDLVESDTVKILFLDYGSHETVKTNTLKALPAALHDTPVAAVQCRLHPLPDAFAQFTELFTTITADNEVSISPCEEGVSVTMHGLPLTDVFDKATHYSTLSYSHPDLKPTCNVYCTSVEEPARIWVQLAEYEEQLSTLMAALAEYCPEAPGLYTTAPGTVCCALFPDDETWYRAEIQKVAGDKLTVQFVDYGNTCEVEKSGVKLLPEEHLVLPVNSVLVRLAHIRPATGTKYSDPVIDKLFEITNEKVCEMALSSYRAMQHVTLTVEEVDVTASLCELDDAKHVPDPELLTVPALSRAEGEAAVYIAHIEQVDEIFGQLEENFEQIEALAPELADLVSVDQPFKPLQCWANWSDALYRAVLTDFSEKEADVWFVDYGNKDKVKLTDLYYLKPEHVELAGQALPLKLAGIKPVRGDTWDSKAKAKLTEVLMDKSTTISLPALESVTVGSEPAAVGIRVEESCVSELMKSGKVARSEVQPPVLAAYPEHVFSEEVAVYCVEVAGTTATCQLAAVQEIQDKLQEVIVEGHPDYLPQEVTVEMACVCKFYTDAQWYRAQVKEVNGDRVTVQFVDYGNSQVSKLSEIQLLPAELNAPPQVFDIQLANTQDMSETDILFLPKVMVTDDELILSVTADKTAACYKVAEDARTDVVTAAVEYCAAVGSYPLFPALEADHVVYTCEIVSPEELYVQIDGSEEVLEKILAMMTEHTEKSTVSAPFVGQPVLATFEDALYRGVVTELRPDNSYSVRFVDYGNSAVVKEVYEILPAEVSTPPQAFRCVLDLATPLPGSDKYAPTVKDRLSAICSDKELVVVEVKQAGDAAPGVMDKLYVSLSQDERNVRMKLLQENLIGDTDESLGSHERVPKPHKPVEVLVTHIENQDLFFGYRTGGEKEEKDEDDDTPEEEDNLINADSYIEEYQTVLEDASPAPLPEVEVGTLCVTRWEGALYRAVVLWIKHNYVKVRFIDYGNCWYTSLTELLDCPEPFRGPGLALPFSGKLDNEKQVVAETEYLVTLSEVEVPAGVIPVSVAMPAIKLKKYKYSKLDITTPTQLFVSVPLPHGQVFCQSAEGGELLETSITPLIAEAIKARTPAPHVVLDAPVLGAYDGAYYRGKVVSVLGGGKAKVLFVDYGNTEECSKLLDVSAELMAVPVVGINCQLQGLSWIGLEGQALLDTHVFADAELTVTASDYHKTLKQHAVTVVTAEEVDVIAAVSAVNMSEKVLVQTSERLFPLNTFLPLYCSKFNSPADFCCQSEEDTALLDTIATAGAACRKINLVAVAVGTACLVQDPKDKAYYRAVVTSPSQDNPTVHYVDYGNRETLDMSALYDISTELLEHKICGIQCTLPELDVPEGGWDAATITQLQTLCNPETELDISVLCATDSLYTVQVVVNKTVVRSTLPAPALKPLPQLFNYPKFSGPLDLFVSVGNNAADFYGQREQDGDRLAVLQTLVDKTDKETPLEDVASGAVCIGESVADEGLYRSAVLSVKTEERTALVRYVDYGNTEQISLDKIFPISSELLCIPVYAVPLSLFGIEVPDTWEEAALTKFAELCYEDAAVTVTPRNWSTDYKCEGDVKTETGCLKTLLAQAGLITNTDPDFSLPEPAAAVEPAAAEPAAPAEGVVSVLKYHKLEEGPNTLYVSVANSPTDFYLQKEEWTDELAALQGLVDSAEQVVLSNPAPGTQCFALSTESAGLYRAEVLSTTEAGVLLRYLDYGNQETVPADKVYQLTEPLLAVPVYAVPCSLVGEVPDSQPALQLFNLTVAPDAQVTITPVTWTSTSGRHVCNCTVTSVDSGADLAQSMCTAAQ